MVVFQDLPALSKLRILARPLIRLFRKVLITSICIAPAVGGGQFVRAYSEHPQQLFSALLKQDILRLQRALRCFESLESVATPCESN